MPIMFHLIRSYQKQLFLFLLLILSALLLSPGIDYHPFIAQGDHGRDFYAFWATANGAKPYTDYWWVYGPLMPYYFSLFFKLFGIKISSILLAKSVLMYLSGIFFYLTLTTIMTPFFAFLGSLWFLVYQPDFFYTFNHSGGILLIIIINYFLFRYIKEQNFKFLVSILGCIFLLNLVKINMGLSSLFCIVVSVFLIHYVQKHKLAYREKIRLSILLTGLLLLTLAVYIFFLYPLSNPEIRQCLPYLGDDQPHHAPLWVPIRNLIVSIFKNMTSNFVNLALAVLIIFSSLKTLHSFLKDKDQNNKKQLFLAVFILTLSYLSYLNEFLMSAIAYRTGWAKPFSFFLIFVVIFQASKNFSTLIRFLLGAALSIVLLMQVNSAFTFYRGYKVSSNFLPLPHAQIYLGNPLNWRKTVYETVHYLNTHLQKDELFFSLPYDPLYYYLCAKSSPTRQLIFFNHIHIPLKQEKKIIQELEKNNTRWILLSNRAYSQDTTLGYLGKTYCPIIGEYIAKHFNTEIEFGQWGKEPGWIENHAVRILKRKE